MSDSYYEFQAAMCRRYSNYEKAVPEKTVATKDSDDELLLYAEILKKDSGAESPEPPPSEAWEEACTTSPD